MMVNRPPMTAARWNSRGLGPLPPANFSLSIGTGIIRELDNLAQKLNLGEPQYKFGGGTTSGRGFFCSVNVHGHQAGSLEEYTTQEQAQCAAALHAVNLLKLYYADKLIGPGAFNNSDSTTTAFNGDNSQNKPADIDSGKDGAQAGDDFERIAENLLFLLADMPRGIYSHALSMKYCETYKQNLPADWLLRIKEDCPEFVVDEVDAFRSIVAKRRAPKLAAVVPTKQPIAAQPTATQSVAVQPATIQPVTIQPVAVQPVTIQPAAIQPVAVQPVIIQPAAVQPVATQSITPQPFATQPKVAQPIAAQPIPLTPKPQPPAIAAMFVNSEIRQDMVKVSIGEASNKDNGGAKEIISDQVVATTHVTKVRFSDKVEKVEFIRREGEEHEIIHPPPLDHPPPFAVPESGIHWHVFVTLVKTPADFTVRLLGEEYSEQFEPMQRLMQEFYETNDMGQKLVIPSSSDIHAYDSLIGNVYAARAEECWHRVYLNEVIPADEGIADEGQGTSASVYFIDHGDYETVSLDELRILEQPFMRLPCQAAPVCLSGFENVSVEDFTVEMIDRFRELVLAKILAAKYVGTVTQTQCAGDGGMSPIGPYLLLLAMPLASETENANNVESAEQGALTNNSHLLVNEYIMQMKPSLMYKKKSAIGGQK